jgi:replicative DNA helicase
VANAAYRRDGGLAGLSTGLADLDQKLGGLHPSDLLILAGRPSMGKTSLATNIAFAIAKAYRKGVRQDGTPWCARRTATTMARTYCVNTTSACRTS